MFGAASGACKGGRFATRAARAALAAQGAGGRARAAQAARGRGAETVQPERREGAQRLEEGEGRRGNSGVGSRRGEEGRGGASLSGGNLGGRGKLQGTRHGLWRREWEERAAGVGEALRFYAPHAEDALVASHDLYVLPNRLRSC